MEREAMIVRFYGSLADRVGRMIETNAGDVAQLRAHISAQHPGVAADLRRAKAIIDGMMVTDARAIGPGDEVEFLPPVSGG